MESNAQGGSEVWSARSPAVCASWVIDEGHQRLAVLSHPTLPFPDAASTLAGPLDRELRRIAMAYLRRVFDSYRPEGQDRDAAFDAACTMLPASVDAPVDGFGWLGIHWGSGADQADPRLSFWVERRRDGAVLDRTVVLLAANGHLKANGRQVCEGSAVGLRVVMQVGAAQHPEAPIAVRVTGLFKGNLLQALTSTN